MDDIIKKCNQSVEPLINCLRKQNFNVKEKAAYALGEIADSRAIESLIEYLNNSIVSNSDTMIKAIAKFGKQAIESLINSLNLQYPNIRII